MSDKKKGIGANDIYVAPKINLGMESYRCLVNTPFNEGSPKIYDDHLFSSNGFPIGKSDVFKCKIIKDSVFDVKHLHIQ